MACEQSCRNCGGCLVTFADQAPECPRCGWTPKGASA